MKLGGLLSCTVMLVACGGGGESSSFGHTQTNSHSSDTPVDVVQIITDIPTEAMAEDVSKPDHIIGTGTAQSCHAADFIQAVAQGGRIVFNCGSAPVTLTLEHSAKIFNDANPDVVIDGGGLITLDGANKTRLIYMNTCDESLHWTTSHCQNQDHPRLTLQNITLQRGNSVLDTQFDGGGAVWVRGGRFKVVNSHFRQNVCASTGPDVGGGAIRVFSQYENLPVYVLNSTFGGGEGLGNRCSNGGAISSIGVSWTIINSRFSYNQATGYGANPAAADTPGGGSGGAIYNDGNRMTLTLLGVDIQHNQVNAHGASVFFVSNDHTGDIYIQDSLLSGNLGGSWYPTYPSISNHSDTPIVVVNSLIE